MIIDQKAVTDACKKRKSEIRNKKKLQSEMFENVAFDLNIICCIDNKNTFYI